MSSKIRALLLSAVLVMSMVAMVAPISATSSATTSGPDGVVGVPSENVGPPDKSGAPDGAGPPMHAVNKIPTEASAWGVQASKHAGDLQVEVGQTSSGEFAMRLSDDRNHEGRRVAVDRSTLIDAVGHAPKAAHGIHESGETWTSPIEYVGSSATFRVPHFSTNTVTFDGEVVLTGSPASDGASYNYEVSDSSGVSDFNITLTGSTATAWDNVSATNLANGDSMSVNVGGTTEPTGPSSNGEPVVHFTGKRGDGDTDVVFHDTNNNIKYVDKNGEVTDLGVQATTVGAVGDFDGDNDLDVAYRDSSTDHLKTVDTSGNTLNLSVKVQARGIGSMGDIDGDGSLEIAFADTSDNLKFADSSGTITDTGATAHAVGGVHDIDGDGDVDILYSTPSPYNLKYTDKNGNTADTGVDAYNPGGIGDFDGDGDVDMPYRDTNDYLHYIDPSGNAVNTSVEVWNVGGMEDIDDDGDLDIAYRDRNNDAIDYVDSAGNIGSTGETGYGVGYTADFGSTEDPGIDIDGDGVDEASVSGSLAAGTTATRELASLSTSDDTATINTTSGSVDVDIDLKERTQSVDPTIEANGQIVANYNGTLSDGSTTTINADETAIVDGSNTVNVTVADSSDGPLGQVGLEYRHTAATNQSVEFESETWSESYNVSKTWLDDRTDATLTIPFESSRIVEVRTLEVRTNGSTWQQVSDYTLNGTELTVNLGSVSADEKTEVRAVGSKVQVENGAINVVDPTVLGNSLDTKIELTDYSSNMSIGVGGSSSGKWVHYTTKESWSTPDSYVTIGDSGSQELYMPEATTGATTRVRTSLLEAKPKSGTVKMSIDDPAEPRFTVRGGSADQVELGWYDTVSGQKYALYSVDRDIDVDTDTAESPVWFTMGTTSDTYLVEERSGGASPAMMGPTGGNGGGLQWALMFAAISAAIAGLWYISRRFGSGSSRGIRGNSLLLVGGTVVGAVAVELVTPVSFVATVLRELRVTAAATVSGTAGTIVIGLAILLGIWLLDQRLSRDIPLPLLAAAGLAVMLWVVEAIAPGTLSGGLAQIGPLFWLAVIGGGLWFARQWIRARRQPDTKVTLQLGDK